MKTPRMRQLNSAKEKAPPKTTPSTPPTHEEIRQRAHQIYAARGGTSGKELEDWLLAEQQLKQGRGAANLGATQ